MQKQTQKIILWLLGILLLILTGVALWLWWTSLIGSNRLTSLPTNINQVYDKNANKISDFLDKKISQYLDTDQIAVIISTHPTADTSSLSQFGVQQLAPNTYGAKITKSQLRSVSQLDAVLVVEEDQIIRGSQAEGFGDFNPNNQPPTDTNTGRAPPIRVAVVDSGIDPNYPFDLSDKIAGWYDVINGQSSPYDDKAEYGQHGTKVTATMLASAPDNTEVVGVKVLDSKNNGETSNLIKGLQWVSDNATRLNIKVVNISIIVDEYSYSLNRIVDDLTERGIVVVAAAGNGGTHQVSYPAVFDSVISVGAYDDNADKIADFSDGGSDADLLANGVDVTLDANGNELYIGSGTSFAAPQVVGEIVAALNSGVKSDRESLLKYLQNKFPTNRIAKDKSTGTQMAPSPTSPTNPANSTTQPDSVAGGEITISGTVLPTVPQGASSGASATESDSDYVFRLLGNGYRDGNFFWANGAGSKPLGYRGLLSVQNIIDMFNRPVDEYGTLMARQNMFIWGWIAKGTGTFFRSLNLARYNNAHSPEPFGYGSPSGQYYGTAATKLANGDILITGGTLGGADPLKGTYMAYGGAWLYHAFATKDYRAGEIEELPRTDTNVNRAWHSSTLLPDGNVLLAGGYVGGGQGLVGTRTDLHLNEDGTVSGWDFPWTNGLGAKSKRGFEDTLPHIEEDGTISRAINSNPGAGDNRGLQPTDSMSVYLTGSKKIVSYKDYSGDDRKMLYPRAHHTATLIPGTNQVLFMGGAFPKESVIARIFPKELTLGVSSEDANVGADVGADVFPFDNPNVEVNVALTPVSDLGITQLMVRVYEKVTGWNFITWHANVSIDILGDAHFMENGKQTVKTKLWPLSWDPGPKQYNATVVMDGPLDKANVANVLVKIKYRSKEYSKSVTASYGGLIQGFNNIYIRQERSKIKVGVFYPGSDDAGNLSADFLVGAIRNLGYQVETMQFDPEAKTTTRTRRILERHRKDYTIAIEGASGRSKTVASLSPSKDISANVGDVVAQDPTFNLDLGYDTIILPGKKVSGAIDTAEGLADQGLREVPTETSNQEYGISGEILHVGGNDVIKPLSQKLPNSFNHTAIALDSGEVLIAGGGYSAFPSDDHGKVLTTGGKYPTILLYQPSRNKFRVFVAPFLTPLADLQMLPLRNATGKMTVALVGGVPAGEFGELYGQQMATWPKFDGVVAYIFDPIKLTLTTKALEQLKETTATTLDDSTQTDSNLSGIQKIWKNFTEIISLKRQPKSPGPAEVLQQAIASASLGGNKYLLISHNGATTLDFDSQSGQAISTAIQIPVNVGEIEWAKDKYGKILKDTFPLGPPSLKARGIVTLPAGEDFMGTAYVQAISTDDGKVLVLPGEMATKTGQSKIDTNGPMSLYGSGSAGGGSGAGMSLGMILGLAFSGGWAIQLFETTATSMAKWIVEEDSYFYRMLKRAVGNITVDYVYGEGGPAILLFEPNQYPNKGSDRSATASAQPPVQSEILSNKVAPVDSTVPDMYGNKILVSASANSIPVDGTPMYIEAKVVDSKGQVFTKPITLREAEMYPNSSVVVNPALVINPPDKIMVRSIPERLENPYQDMNLDGMVRGTNEGYPYDQQRFIVSAEEYETIYKPKIAKIISDLKVDVAGDTTPLVNQGDGEYLIPGFLMFQQKSDGTYSQMINQPLANATAKYAVAYLGGRTNRFDSITFHSDAVAQGGSTISLYYSDQISADTRPKTSELLSSTWASQEHKGDYAITFSRDRMPTSSSQSLHVVIKPATESAKRAKKTNWAWAKSVPLRIDINMNPASVRVSQNGTTVAATFLNHDEFAYNRSFYNLTWSGTADDAKVEFDVTYLGGRVDRFISFSPYTNDFKSLYFDDQDYFINSLPDPIKAGLDKI